MLIDYSVIKDSWGEEGFLGKLREGFFDKTSYNTLCETFLKLQSKDFDVFDKEFVSVVWFIPIFMGRQKEYINDISSVEYERLKENIEELIAGIFGYP